MKIALATLYNEAYDDLAKVVLPNWLEYVNRHKYELLVNRGAYGAESSSIGFQKAGFVYDQLFHVENKWDAALVLDLDILITNMTIKVESFIDDTHDYFVTTGFNGLCNGSYIVKKSQGGREVLEYILENKYGCSNEQDMLKNHLDETVLQGRLKLFPHTAFGSIPLTLYPEHKSTLSREDGNWEKGDFLVHYPGRRLDARVDLFTKMLGDVVR